MVLLNQCSRNLTLLLLGRLAFLLQISHWAKAMCFHVCLGFFHRICEYGNHCSLHTWHLAQSEAFVNVYQVLVKYSWTRLSPIKPDHGLICGSIPSLHLLSQCLLSRCMTSLLEPCENIPFNNIALSWWIQQFPLPTHNSTHWFPTFIF